MEKKGHLLRIEPKIKERLAELGVSQGWLSRMMSLDRGTINRYCNGNLLPHFERCLEMAVFLACHVEDLWILKDSEKP
jgi:DNA-binding XRE family transcriptional regulator